MFLEDRRYVGGIVGLSVSPLLLTLGRGLSSDDHYLYQLVRRSARPPWDLFRVTSEPGEMEGKIARGEVPWFFPSNGTGAFLRPLASVFHYVEFKWLGRHPWALHAHSLLWLVALLLVAAWIVRSFEGPGWRAGFATILYTFCPAAAVSASWIAARNSLMATVLGFGALGAHHAWRSGRLPRGGVPVLLLLASLASGEASAGPLAYLLGYAVLFERGPFVGRFKSVAPYALIAVAWYGAERALGYGSAGNALYTDLGIGPVALLPIVASRFLNLVALELGWTGVQLINGRVDALITGGDAPSRPFFLFWIVPILLTLGIMARCDRTSRYWIASSFASMLPFCLTTPQPRLLLAAHLGMSVAWARMLRAPHFDSRPVNLSLSRGWVMATVLVAFACLAGWPSMLAQNVVIGSATPFEMGASRLFDSFAGKDVVCVAGDWILPHTAVAMQEERGARPVRSVMVLASSSSFEIERPDPRTLVLRAPVSLLGNMGNLLRSTPFAAGDVVRSARANVEILAVSSEHKPTAVRYLFDSYLEDPTLAWVTTLPSGIVVPAPPIPTGSSVTVSGSR